MTKAIRSPIAKVIMFIAGYIAAFSVARDVSRAFNYYAEHSLGGWMKMGIAVSFFLFVICLGLFCASVWLSKNSGFLRIWRKFDFSVLVVFALGVVFLCAYYLLNRPAYILLLFYSAVAYAAVMALIAETVARLRDKTLRNTLYWPRFFRLYPPRKPIGLLMAVILAGNLLYLLVICPLGAAGVWLQSINFKSSIFYTADYPYVAVPLGFNIFLYVFSAMTLAALTYFCAFVLSLSAEYEQANAEKIRSERFKAELITNVSHDIRTPLMSIINYVDLLKALPVERDDFSEYVSVLDKKSARLKSLINGLMEASKAATGNIAVNMREIDLTEIVGQIAGEFDDQFAERGLTFVFRQSEERVFVKADSDLLWRVLENLFGNAAKYALPDTRIFAEITGRDGRTVLSLKNTSQNPIDMPADTLTEQFIRGDRARQTDGNGLGMYIAKSLVELMGGRFTIRVTGDLFEAEVLL